MAGPLVPPDPEAWPPLSCGGAHAAPATPEGTCRTAAERQRNLLRLSFENDGPALAGRDLALLFERFRHSKRSRDSAGIGLAIVKGLVEAHGGQVGAGSGEGRLRIWVTLPV